MEPIRTQHFESGGEQLVSFGHMAYAKAAPSHSYWTAILTIDDAEDFVCRLSAHIAEAKAARARQSEGEGKVIFSQDGNQRCATRPGFVNLQESPAGFGDTDADALADLEKAERADAAKVSAESQPGAEV